MFKMNRTDALVKYLLMALALIISLYIAYRNYGLYPVVFSDELSYSKFTRIVPFSDASLPNYIYYLVYRVTDVCGDGYLDCVRFFNLAFYVTSVPFIYLIGKMTCHKRSAMFISILSFAGASNSYTAYFMPEAMYYFMFWVISWLALRIKAEDGIMLWLSLSVAIGLASLVKPHALFLIPAISLYAYYLISGFSFNNYLHSAKIISIIVFSTIFIKLLIGYILAGRAGLTLFGTFYAPYAESAVSSGVSHYLDMAEHTAFSLIGHLISISIIYGVPFAILLSAIFRLDFQQKKSATPFARLNVYTFLILTTLVMVSALYTASISGSTPGNHLHVRYYFFALPLLYLVAGSSGEFTRQSFITKFVIATPISIAIIFAIFTGFSNYEMYSSTAPELFGIVSNKTIFIIITSASLAALLIWVASEKIGAVCYLSVFVPIMTACSLSVIGSELTKRKQPDVFDKAGIYAREKLNQEERNSSVIIGDAGAIGGLFRTLFYFDTPNLNYLEVNTNDSEIFGVPPGSEFNVSSLNSEKKYLIVIGQHKIIGNTNSIYCDEELCIKKIKQR